MKIYEIRNKNLIYAYLFFDFNTKNYYIEINEDNECQPIFFKLFLNNNKKILNNYWTNRFISERIIPYERQNIGNILKENNISYYSEILMYVKSMGKSSMDDSFLKEIKEDDLNKNIKKRRKHLIIDFMLLKNKMIVFFKNNKTKIINIEENSNIPFLSSFGEEIIFDNNYRLDYEYVYSHGKKSDLTYNDLINYMKLNLYNSHDIEEEYNISRQYVNKINQRLIKIKDNIYLKNDIMLNKNN